jgi:sphingomyelin phosphodiesterase
MITEKFKLISLNTGYCEVTNFFVYLNQTDPDGTLKWLVDELYDAEKRGLAVHIMAHIPPGDAECLEGWARNYYRIVTRYIIYSLFIHKTSISKYASPVLN